MAGIPGVPANWGVDAQTIKRNQAERNYCLSGSLVYVREGMRCTQIGQHIHSVLITAVTCLSSSEKPYQLALQGH